MSNDTSSTTSTSTSTTAIPSPIGAVVGSTSGSSTASVGGSVADQGVGTTSIGIDPTNGTTTTPPAATSLKQTIFDLLTSKKFLVALAAIAVWLTGRFGFDADPQILDRIWVTLMVVIFGQGMADIGKGKTIAAARLGIRGTSLLVLCLIAPSLLACTTLKGAEGPVETAAIECASIDVGPAFLDVQTKCGSSGTIDNQCAEQIALADLKNAGDCLLIQLLDDEIRKLNGTTSTLTSTSTSTSTTGAAPHIAATRAPAPTQDDIQRWRSTVEDFRTKHADGAKFRVDGVLR